MSISSRTPEGEPNRCPVCGKRVIVEPSRPPGDAPCPNCGQLLWWFQDHLSNLAGVARDRITLGTLLPDLLDELGQDSLDTVEFVMAMEEEFDINIPEEDAQNIKTVADAIRYIEKRRQERGEK